MTTALDTDDDAIIARLTVGDTPTEAAVATGRSYSTVLRRLRDPMFRAKLADARAGELRGYAAAVMKEVPANIARLVQLRDNAKHESTQLRAAVALLEFAFRLHTECEILPRLAAL